MLHALRVSKPSSIAPLPPLPQRPLFVQFLLQPSSFHQYWPSVPFPPGKLPSPPDFLVFTVCTIKISYLAFLLPLFALPLRVSPLHCLTSLLWQGLLYYLVTQSCATPWTVAHQAPLPMGFLRQEYWSGLPFPSPGNLLSPEIELISSASAGIFFTTVPPGKTHSRESYFFTNPRKNQDNVLHKVGNT